MNRFLSILLVPVLFLSGCSALSIPTNKEMTELSKGWNKMVLWGEYEKACGMFADVGHQEQCRKPFDGKGLDVTDVSVKEILWDQDGKGVTQVLAMEYVKTPSATVKQLVYRQRWEVRDGHWQLTGPPPQFP